MIYLRVEWRGLRANFNTQNRCFLHLQISVELCENLWQESEFQNIEWGSLAIIRVSEYTKEGKRTLCAPNVVSPFHSIRGVRRLLCNAQYSVHVVALAHRQRTATEAT